MPAERLGVDLAEQLAQAQTRIAELESENAKLRESRGAAELSSFQTPFAILDNITYPFVAVDSQLRYVWVNSEAERSTGIVRTDWLGRTIQEFPLADPTRVFEQKVREAVAAKAPTEFEHYYPPLDRWFRNRTFPLQDGGAAISWQEITEQKRLREHLRQSEERLRLTAGAVEGIVYDWDPRTGKVHRSGNLEKLIGLRLEVVEDTDLWWQNRIHPDDAHHSTLRLLKTLPPETTNYETEFRFRHADGRWLDLCDHGYVFRDRTGTVTRVVGGTVDVSQRKRLEKELRDSHAQLQFQAAILTATNDAVIALDSDDKITYCNAGAERMYRVTRRDVIGRGLTAIHTTEWASPEEELRAKTLFSERGSWTGENVHVRRDGSRLEISSTANALPAEAGGGRAFVNRDISAQKRAERENLRYAAELARANDDLLHFAYSVSHDLLAPVRTVTSFSQLLALRYSAQIDGQAGEYLNFIVQAGSRMSAMINDLLELAKAAGSDVPLQPDVPLEGALGSAIENLRSLIRETAATVTHDPLPVVAADASQMAQLFQNLIGNSLKYRKPRTPPKIHVSVQRENTEWVIGVHDNGIGFPNDQAERIFEVFHRLHGGEFAGTGVGLAICRRIVERRSGRIWATAQPGQGATFYFSLPDSAVAPAARQWPTLGTSEHPAPRRVVPYSSPEAASPFDELFQTLDLAQCMVRDLDGRIQIWTQGAERLLGWSKAEAIGQRLHELLKTEFPKPQEEIEAELLGTGQWNGQLKQFRKDGGALWLANHWELYRDGSGRPQSVIEVTHDISPLIQAEAALRQSSEQRDLALRAGEMGVWRWDPLTGTVTWDETIERLHGMAPGSFDGTYESFRRSIHPDDVAKIESHIGEAMERGPDYAVEFRAVRTDGTVLWLHGQGKVIREGGVVTGLVGVVWDIDSRKREELDREFLLQLSAKITGLDLSRIVETTTLELARYLGAARCSYGELDETRKWVTIVAEYDSDGHTLAGTYEIASFVNYLVGTERNGLLAVDDTEKDVRTMDAYDTRYRPVGIRALLSASLDRDRDGWAVLSVADRKPRPWTAREKQLLHSVVERLCPALENARLIELTQERQSRFEGTFQQAAVGMAHIGLDGGWLRVNQKICDITGYTREELLQMRFQDITHPDDLSLDLEQYAALQRGEIASYSMEKRYFHKHGSPIWINLTVSLVRGADGEPRYAISVVEDITARKRTALALEESNTLAESLLTEIESIYSEAPIGLAAIDRNLRYTRVNRQMAEINGRSATEHLGRRVSEILPEIGPRVESWIQSVLDSGKALLNLETRGTALARSAEERTRLESYFPQRGPDGQIRAVNAVIQDITDRKRTETAWLEAADRLRIASSAAKLGVFAWDAQNDRAYWENRQMYEITGRNREDGPVNRAEFLQRLIHPDDVEGFQHALVNLTQPDHSFHHTCRIRRLNDGAIRWVEFSGRFESQSYEALPQLTGVMADVTERKEAEEAAVDRRQLLVRVLDALPHFVAMLRPDGVVLEANQAPLDAVGVTAGDVVGKALPDTFWWSYSEEIQQQIRDAIRKAQTGEASRFDIRARMRDGELSMVDWMISPLRGESGEVQYLIHSAVVIEERTRAEEALRRSEERYALAEQATNDGLWDWDLATGVCYFSPKFKSMLGLKEAELDNRADAIFERVHPEDLPALENAVRLHFEANQPYDGEYRVQLKNGAYRWFRTQGQGLRDAAGKVVRMIGSMSDIHDRREAEALTRQTDEQLRIMMNSIDQLAWMGRPDGFLFWYNQRWYQYTGTTPEQMEGWGWQSVHDPQVLPAVMRQWKVSIETGQPFEMEFPIRGADGVFRSFLTRALPVRDSKGQVIRWLGTNTNVDALRKEQDLLKESERSFRELAESLPDMVWGADAQGAITYWNPQLYAYTGLAPGHGFAHNWVAIIHPDDRDRLFQIWQNSVESGQHHEYESRIRRHDGVYRWFLNRAEPIRDQNGRIVKWLGTSTDIHEQKLTEQALRRSNEDLEQFAYAASHDLQEPLRTVSIYSQLLAQKYIDETGEAKVFATYLVESAKRMESLLKGILDYSRAGDPAEGCATIDADSALREALHNLASAIQQSGAEVTHGELPPVAFPTTHLVQLFQNLIGNAIKYRADGSPKIRVDAVKEGRWIRFSVQDDGIGIKPAYLEQIFGVFKRLHRSEYPGVGVGLAICKRIVERQGGRIWAHSELGVGSTFCFTLPSPSWEGSD